jgi:hypothetical protein
MTEPRDPGDKIPTTVLVREVIYIKRKYMKGIKEENEIKRDNCIVCQRHYYRAVLLLYKICLMSITSNLLKDHPVIVFSSGQIFVESCLQQI